MPITAASVEANGWVLRVTLTGGLGSFASYALDADMVPRVVLTSSHPGFVKSAGTAVGGNLLRTLVATKPVRKPVNPASPTAFVIDETDLGGGSIQVRIALSEHVYATDTGVSLAVLAGWRTGEGAASIGVSNGSTVVAPVPIMRWALAPYEVTAGAFRVSLIVASHHPAGFEPVAGVKFTATDGTTVKTVWATEMSTDNSYGDGLRCYSAIIDPGVATALTAGLLRCDAEVYPWLGAMRPTDTAGTRSMTGLGLAGFRHSAASPWVIGYDPLGTRYSGQWAFVDPAGTLTASAAMVTASLAAAKALPVASRPASINTAIQAGYLLNRTLVAANGQAAATRATDGMNIVLAVGTHSGAGSTAVTTGLTTTEIPPRVMGDPDNASPRVNCILQTGANAVSRATRMRYQALSLETGGTVLGGASLVLFDNIEVRAKAGSETSTFAPFSGSIVAGQWNIAATRSKFWRTGFVVNSGNLRCGLFRGNEHSRSAQGLLFARNRFISSSEDTSVGSTAINIVQGWGAPTEAGQAEDVITAFNDLRSVRARVWTPALLPAATAGTPNPSLRRTVFMGNVCEKIGADPQPFLSFGEDSSATMSYNIIEGNSFVGERFNGFYSDPLPTTIAETNTLLNQAFVNRSANNFFDWFPTKHDAFLDSTTATLRGTADGYRPHMIEAWSHIYGVGHEANVDAGRTGAGNFALEYYGLRSVRVVGGAPAFLDDRSFLGTGVGGGNYRLPGTSFLAGRVVRGNGDRDLAGEERRALSAAGAYVAASLAVDLATTGGRSGSLASSTIVGLRLALTPAPTLHGVRSDSPVVGVNLALRPVPAIHRFSSLQPIVEPEATTRLLPGSGRMGFGYLRPPLLLPAGSASDWLTLHIGVDQRTILVN
nr:hypothetical protein [Polymorphobacter sp.]